tara:strand:- start:1002 stop:1820 length:819 start_codon:yes stop_codon:yes gene_type:complete
MSDTTTIKSRVLQILGQDIGSDYLDDINAPEELWSNAVWDIYQKLPHRMLLTNIIVGIDPAGDIGSTDVIIGSGDVSLELENSLALLLTRTYANHAIDSDGVITSRRYIIRPVKKITKEQSIKALETDSIYFATNTSPVYWIDNIGGIPSIKTAPSTTGFDGVEGSVLPLGHSGLVLYKLTRTIYTNNVASATNWDEITLFYLNASTDSLPTEAEDIVIKRIAQVVLQEKANTALVDDEDSEIAELLLSTIKTLAEDISTQLETFKVKWEGS